MKFRLEKKRKKKQPSKLSIALAPWKMQLIIGVAACVLIGLLGAGVWYGSRIESLQLREINVVGGTTIKPEAIESVVDGVLAETYFRLVPHSFALMYPHDAIVAAVADVPRVRHVRVDRTDWHTLTVVFDEYQPTALACTDETVTSCYFIDTHGYAFAKAPELTGGAMVRYIHKDVMPELKQTLFDDEYMKTTRTFIDGLERDLNLFVVKVIKRDEVDTSYILSTGAELKTSNRLRTEETLTNLTSILKSEEFRNVANGSFHYIDLRFGDKVFVSESEMMATSSEEVGEDTLIEA